MAVSHGRQEFDGLEGSPGRYLRLGPWIGTAAAAQCRVYSPRGSATTKRRRAPSFTTPRRAAALLAAVFLGDVARRSPAPDSAPRAATPAGTGPGTQNDLHRGRLRDVGTRVRLAARAVHRSAELQIRAAQIMISAGVAPTQNGGSRTTAAASNCHAARLAFQRVSVLIADSVLSSACQEIGGDHAGAARAGSVAAAGRTV